jgi:hypothetical protein
MVHNYTMPRALGFGGNVMMTIEYTALYYLCEKLLAKEDRTARMSTFAIVSLVYELYLESNKRSFPKAEETKKKEDGRRMQAGQVPPDLAGTVDTVVYDDPVAENLTGDL